MKFCPDCGARLYKEDQRFCAECGLRLDTLTTPSAPDPLEALIGKPPVLIK